MSDLVVLLLCVLLTIPTEVGCYDGISSKSPCREEERGVLLRFRRSIRDPSNRLSSWAGDDCCCWDGVVCHNTTGRILKLNLRPDLCQSGSLGGEIHSSLAELKDLQYLDLSCNDFQGQNIPKFLGSISSLRYLNLSSAGFGGVIPHQLGNLSRLHYLDIGNSYGLCWSSPYVEHLEWISGLASLEFLDMTCVNLSNASNWLRVMSMLSSLSVLHLSYCDIHTIDPLPQVNLSSLAILDLSYNDIISSSLDSFAHFNSLVELNLASNNIDGPIPSYLRNMTSLKFLDLSLNNFVSIPDWLYQMNTLEHLDLASNNFQAKIPNDIGNLTSLTYLDLSYNSLEADDILTSLANLCTFQLSNFSHSRHRKALEFINLQGNKLVGSFPYTLGQCTSLRHLNLGMNRLSGQIPTSLGGMSSLRDLSINDNFFEGNISEKHFANQTSLENFDASSNLQLTLQVNSNWTPPFQLKELYLGSWTLGPEFPAWLQTQQSLEYLNMSDVGISSAIPTWFWAAPFLEEVYLSHNQIIGNIPSLHFGSMDLSSNNFSGPLPQISSVVGFIDISNNLFLGSLSPALCPGKSEAISSLWYLDMSNNHLSGEIPDCWKYWSHLLVIKLGSNKLSGGIPSSLGSLHWLSSLHLRNNQLSGTLPPSIQNCINLVVVDLAENEFSGSIPMWMGNLTWEPADNDTIFGLMVLLLRSNKFSGEIPPELCNLSHSLQILDLAQNRLSGAIPSCFGNFTPMSIPQNRNSRFFYPIGNHTFYLQAEAALLVTKSAEYEYNSKTLNILTGIDLSCNNLSGQIPHELTNLHSLMFLNLSNNHLQGKIPAEVGAMESLESLDLSINNLSGVIPQSLASISFLSDLNLSYNDFSGRIPSGTQIQSFDPRSFIGNNELCGPPLTNACHRDEAPPGQTSSNASKDEEEEDEWMEMKWFYMSLPLGFVVGFWAILGPLVFNMGGGVLIFNRWMI